MPLLPAETPVVLAYAKIASVEFYVRNAKLSKYSDIYEYFPLVIMELPRVMTCCMSASSKVGAALLMKAPLLR
jgi:hypothetical protein